jgi:hypothetical protein
MGTWEDRATVQQSTRRPDGSRLLPAAVTLALGAFVLLYRGVRRGTWAERDLAATVAVQRLREPWFREFMRVVSWPGFPPQSRVLPWLLAGFWFARGRRLEAVFQMLGWGTGFVSFVVKHRVKRPRPNHPTIVVTLARIGGAPYTNLLQPGQTRTPVFLFPSSERGPTSRPEPWLCYGTMCRGGDDVGGMSDRQLS